MSFITFDRVAKSFGSKTVLTSLSMSLAAGQSLVLLGRSGTGKSVSLKCFLGLMKPDSGSIELDGLSVIGLSPRARRAQMDRVGMLFQGGALFDSLPVWRNIAFRLIEQGARDARDQAIALLDQVDLPASVADLRPSDLSGGMQKRVGLARALAGNPEILLFDEPTAGLDPISAAQINALIGQLTHARGATALTITHNLDSARQIADQVALLHEGQICWTGTPKDMDESPDPAIRQFVDGTSEGPLTHESLTHG